MTIFTIRVNFLWKCPRRPFHTVGYRPTTPNRFNYITLIGSVTPFLIKSKKTGDSWYLDIDLSLLEHQDPSFLLKTCDNCKIVQKQDTIPIFPSWSVGHRTYDRVDTRGTGDGRREWTRPPWPWVYLQTSEGERTDTQVSFTQMSLLTYLLVQTSFWVHTVTPRLWNGVREH